MASQNHSVYVVELDPVVLESKKFREANSSYVSGMPCVYVGMTGLSVEQRFTNHMQGIKSCAYVRRYGLGLVPSYYEALNPMTYKDAVNTERALAEKLRARGFAVWQA